MRKIYGIIITIAVFISIFANSSFTITAASGQGMADGLQINGEYLIMDSDNLHSEYVVIATNKSGKDLSVVAKFFAVGGNGNPIKTVYDSASAIKNGQSFILYGQFKNSELKDVASYSYTLMTGITEDCKYDSVNVDVESQEGVLEVTGTNYSSEDTSLVNVRTIFFKDGSPVAFDHVNLGDSAYSLRSGSSNTQELGQLHPEYDNYLITYSVASDM
ncbi:MULTISPECIES: hypothetical protein [unclassified Butyrivibrio]|uniref:hypothetical protein n=1 Tax=unclassified Butyrivibrio TaxID=2639466 RepID=UPI0003B3A65D|nr:MULTISPECIES: hypothetical protein [unclassified Butyrivibrio]